MDAEPRAARWSAHVKNWAGLRRSRQAADAAGYAAFISYNQEADGELARAVERGLERLATPWYGPRALNVFRADSDLSVSHELWAPIIAELDRSEYFVLLASPEAAQSMGVAKEIERWKETKLFERILLVITGGECHWHAGDFDHERSTAIPPALFGVFAEEPRWLDLRWARKKAQLDLRDSRFRDDIAQLAAPIHGIPKEELVAEDKRLQRRAHRLAWSAVVMLVVLTGVAIGGWIYAVQQRETAISNQIALKADQLRSKDVSLAAQLDRVAHRIQDSPDRYTALITMGNAPLSTSVTGHTDAVWSVVLSPDGNTLASGSADRTVRLWDVSNPTRPKPLGQLLEGHTGAVLSVAFSPDGNTLASGSADRTVRLWDVSNPTRPKPLGQSLEGHVGSVSSVAFSPKGGTLASGGTDRTVQLWNVTDPARPKPLGQPPAGHTGQIDRVNTVAFSPDGRILASGNDRTVRLWNVTNPARPELLGQPLAGHTDRVNTVVFSRDGRILATGNHRAVRLWNVTDPANPTMLVQSLTGHDDPVSSVAFSRDGHTLVTGSKDKTIRLWNIPATLLADHSNYVNAVAFSPDGHTLASGSADRTVHLWNVTDPARPKQLGRPLTGHTELVSVVFSPDRRRRTLASGSVDGTVRLWDVTDPNNPMPLGQLPTDRADRADLVFVAFSPDGRTLASGSIRTLDSGSIEGTVRLWDVTDRNNPTPLGQLLTGGTDSVSSVVFSPDRRTLASGSVDGTVRLWDVTDPNRPKPLGQPPSPTPLAQSQTGDTDRVDDKNNKTVFAVAFSPHGNILASGSGDRTVQLWDVTDPARPMPLDQPLTGHTDFVSSVMFSPDGRTLASGSKDNNVRLWDVTDPNHPAPRGQPLTGHTELVSSVVFSPDGSALASGSGDRTVRVWGMDEKQAIKRMCATTTDTLIHDDWDEYVPDRPYSPLCPP